MDERSDNRLSQLSDVTAGHHNNLLRFNNKKPGQLLTVVHIGNNIITTYSTNANHMPVRACSDRSFHSFVSGRTLQMIDNFRLLRLTQFSFDSHRKSESRICPFDRLETAVRITSVGMQFFFPRRTRS